MILVDSSVWIDFFNGRSTAAAEILTQLLDEAAAPIAIAPMVMASVVLALIPEGMIRMGSVGVGVGIRVAALSDGAALPLRPRRSVIPSLFVRHRRACRDHAAASRGHKSESLCASLMRSQTRKEKPPWP